MAATSGTSGNGQGTRGLQRHGCAPVRTTNGTTNGTTNDLAAQVCTCVVVGATCAGSRARRPRRRGLKPPACPETYGLGWQASVRAAVAGEDSAV